MKLQSASTARDVLRVFWNHLSVYRAAFFSLVGVIALAQTANLVLPFFYKHLIDVLVASELPVLAQQWQEIFVIVVCILAVRFTGWILWRISGFLASYVQPRVVVDLERTSFRYLLHHSYQFFSNIFVGSLVRKVKGLSSGFREIAESFFWHIIPLCVSVFGIIGILLYRRPYIGAAVLVWLLLFAGLNVVIVRRKIKYDLARAAKDSEATGVLSDALTNNLNIKLFTGYEQEQAAHHTVTEELKQLRIRGWRFSEKGNIIQNILNVTAEGVVLFSTVSLWRQGVLSIGEIVLIQQYMLEVFRQTYNIANVLRTVYEALADAKEMVDILHTPFDVQDKRIAKPLVVTRGRIEFQHIDFYYHKTRPVLDDFSLKIQPQEKVALVGSSGAGKSTAVKLLFRFYDVDRGKILIDSQDISRVTQNSLRNAISLVPQEPVLFHRSLKENIGYGKRDASEEEIFAAAKKAHCHEFISQLPQGYETLVGERGVKLSGGERQRVAIARAILKNAPILVLDEATSSLDSESEALIQAALRELMKDKTVIVIAHRLSTIMQMDRIIVMEEGRVVDQGSHRELLEKVGIYQKLWNIQAGGFGA